VGTFVVGTFDNHRAIQALAGNLKSAGCDVSQLRIAGNEEIPTDLATSGAQYVYLGDVQPSGGVIGSAGTGLETGTGVPGLTDSGAQALGYGELGDYLSDLGIPDGKTDAYSKAVDGGEWLAGYLTPPDKLDSVKSAFASAGARSVEVF